MHGNTDVRHAVSHRRLQLHTSHPHAPFNPSDEEFHVGLHNHDAAVLRSTSYALRFRFDLSREDLIWLSIALLLATGGVNLRAIPPELRDESQVAADIAPRSR